MGFIIGGLHLQQSNRHGRSFGGLSLIIDDAPINGKQSYTRHNFSPYFDVMFVEANISAVFMSDG